MIVSATAAGWALLEDEAPNEAARVRLRELRAIVDDAVRAVRPQLVSITSYYRPSDDGTHGDAAAVDFAGSSWEETAQLWAYLARYERDRVGELILEQPVTGVTGHVHLSLPGYGGRGEVLYQGKDGRLSPVDPFLARLLRTPDRAAGVDGDGQPPVAVQ